MFIFCPVRDQPPKHYKDNLLRAKIKYVLFVSTATPISRTSNQKSEKEKTNFPFHSAFTIFAYYGEEDGEM